jgi:spore germination protein YaaH
LWEYYRDHPEMVGKDLVPPALAKRSDLMQTQTLNKVVYGFHPYWQNGQESNYYLSLLTHIAYFSGDVDAATGNFTSTHSWSSANVVALAQQYGVKVHFSVVLFADHATFLASTAAKNNLIANIMAQINLRNADGCNIDFESISGSQAAGYRDFLKQLGDTLKVYNKELVVELFAVDWNGIFPSTFFSTLNSVVDYYFIMLYDYYYSGSSTAGPVAPLMNTTSTSYRHVLRSIKTYTDIGAPASKLIAGFPSYGYDWPVVSETRMASATASGTSRTYSVSKNNYLDTVTVGNKFVDGTFNVPWYRYQSGGTWRQVWYDDSLSWAKKFDSIKVKNVAGTGMWALGYDGSEPELWGALKSAFAQTADAAHTSFDSFESGLGHFTTVPTYSGSTVGVSTGSTSAVTNDIANNGAQSLQLVLKDNTAITTNWTVRHLSGSGSRANNIQFSKNGYIGLWIKTNTAPAGAQIALAIDDTRSGSTDRTELSSKQNIVNDGNWNLYEWNLAGGGWTSFSGGNGVLDSTTLSLDAVMLYANNSASDWTVYLDDVSHNTSGTLPVELREFSGFNKNLQVHVQWSTATEQDNYGFEIERKNIGHPERAPIILVGETKDESWVKLGFLQGHGTISTLQSYSFIDAVAKPGTYAYRLRQIDRNGAFRYSTEIQVTVSAVAQQFSLEQNYPNPFNPVTTIQFTIPDGSVRQPVSLIVYDMLGREMAVLINGSLEPGIHSVQWDASRSASGIYFYTLRTSGYTDTKRMILVK